MNIQYTAKLYKSFHRVLKIGGRLAIDDPVKGNDQPIIYPTPWARDDGISFMASEGEIKEALAEAGFKSLSCIDKTEGAAQWFGELLSQREQQQPTGQAPNPLSAPVILGPQMGPAIANFANNVTEGRVRILQIIAAKV